MTPKEVLNDYKTLKAKADEPTPKEDCFCCFCGKKITTTGLVLNSGKFMCDKCAVLYQIATPVREEHKMKPKEALEKLNHTICLNANGKNLKWNIDIDEHIDCVDVDEFCDCYEILDEVLTEYAQLKAKAEPMKPLDIQEGAIHVLGECPVCKKVVFSDNSYCPYCGQALDWSDEE